MKYMIALIVAIFAVMWVLLQIVHLMPFIGSIFIVFCVAYIANKIVWAMFGTQIAARVLK